MAAPQLQTKTASRPTSSTVTSIRRTLRRSELKQMVPLGDTTIYEMEQRGEFPRRFHLSPRCVVWDFAEVDAWLEQRRQAMDTPIEPRPFVPDVRDRRIRPVRS